MTTLGQLIDLIADDINRSDLDTQILQAINDSIDILNTKKVWYTQTTANVTLSAGDTIITTSENLPTDIKSIRFMKTTINSDTYPVTEKDITEVENLNGGTTTGDPVHYAWWANSLYIYPEPESANVLTIYYNKSYPAISDTASTNDHITYATNYLRDNAEALLYSRVLKNSHEANERASFANKHLNDLLQESDNFATQNITPTNF